MDDADCSSLSDVYYTMTLRLRPEFKQLFERLAAGVRRPPVVMHCFSGKDRTGLASGLVLDSCGVERAAIAEDYALSGVCLQELFDSWVAAAPPSDRARLAAELATDPRALLELFERLDGEWGGTTAFLLGCGVSQLELEELWTAVTS